MSRLIISMTEETASAVSDALAYFAAASENNFDGGYERGEDGRCERRKHDLVRRFSDRLNKRLETPR